MSCVSKGMEDTNGCANQYSCDLDIYLLTVLSSLYGIIMDRTKMHLVMEIMLLMESIQQTNII